MFKAVGWVCNQADHRVLAGVHGLIEILRDMHQYAHFPLLQQLITGFRIRHRVSGGQLPHGIGVDHHADKLTHRLAAILIADGVGNPQIMAGHEQRRDHRGEDQQTRQRREQSSQNQPPPAKQALHIQNQPLPQRHSSCSFKAAK